MWMELQGKKATHDFLSLYTKETSFTPQEPPSSQGGFLLKTHDFLRPLERGSGAAEGEAVNGNSRSEEHALPGGIGTYSISHAPAVKHEQSTCALVVARASSVVRKPCISGGPGLALWDESINASRDTGSRAGHPLQPPPPPPQSTVSAAASVRSAASFASHSSSRHRRLLVPGNKRTMDLERGFNEHDEEEEELGRREASSGKVGLQKNTDAKNSNDQKPSTPRSKHSATEQRRRCKINDRFQILRDLIPHSDQKRDKASFLLEVIEYIRFLQERMQKYESLYPGWGQETTKQTPWRSNQGGPGASIASPSQPINNGPSGFLFSGNDDSVAGIPAVLPNAHNQTEYDVSAAGSFRCMENSPGLLKKAATIPVPLQGNVYGSVGREPNLNQPQQTSIVDTGNLALDLEDNSRWLRSTYNTDCNTSNEMHEQELTIDEGTISISSMYSQGILNSMSSALQSSGIDLSQANISVQINLGRRAYRRPTSISTMCSTKDHDGPPSISRAVGQSRVGSTGEESQHAPHAPKRHKADNS